ncbi:redoxin domain-containing protein [Puniceicoccaceae bacterium K14]|nr:redoxin domain-containing protein [Puniceicoccaceae bacterium K14]
MAWTRFLVLVLCLSISQLWASDRALPEDLEGRAIDPFEASSAKVIVFVFLAEECPIANRYVPRLNRYAAKYGAGGVSFRAVYADEKLSVERIQKHQKDYSLEMPVLRDVDKWLVAKTGVKVTPEAAVYNRSESGLYELVYLGRIDDQYQDFGKWRREPNKKELEEVLDALLDGEILAFRETRAIGCYIGE